MRILVTGAGGFVGTHLTRHLEQALPDAYIYGTVRHLPKFTQEVRTSYQKVDLLNLAEVRELIEHIQPDAIYHLAAQAFVPRSFENPWETIENNVRGQLHLFEACLSMKTLPRILITSSAQIFGVINPDELPLTEKAAAKPSSPYSVSKIAQEMLGLQYFMSHHIPVMIARPFNHVGPGQTERFAIPAFGIQIARIEAGLQEPIIRVGNLESRRDYTDVRDIVRAYQLIIEKGIPGQTYNIASGVARSMSEILEMMLRLTDKKITIHVDENRLRPIDIPVIEGDYSLLRETTGWQPRISLQESLQAVLDDCRARVSAEL